MVRQGKRARMIHNAGRIGNVLQHSDFQTQTPHLYPDMTYGGLTPPVAHATMGTLFTGYPSARLASHTADFSRKSGFNVSRPAGV